MFYPSQLTKRNSVFSPLLTLPPELLKLVILHLHNPLDMLSISFTCHELFHLITPTDWFLLAKLTFKNWIKSCGGAVDQNWKNIVLRHTALRVRLEQHLPDRPNYHLYCSSIIPLPDTSTFTSLQNAAIKIPSLQIPLSESQQFHQGAYSKSLPWFHTVSPTYSIDKESNTTITVSMVTRPITSSIVSGIDPRPHEHQILFYNLPNLSQPVAICEKYIWEQDNTANSAVYPWCHPFTRDMLQVAQVVAIKHFPKHIKNGKFRVIIVIAFGQRAQPIINQSSPSHFLSIWLLLKVIELWIPVYPFTLVNSALINHFQNTTPLLTHKIETCQHIDLSDVTNIESIEPRQHQITMQGYFVKLFAAEEPQTRLNSPLNTINQQQPIENIHKQKTCPVDCIAIFGIQNSDNASAIIIKKILFKIGDSNNNLSSKTYSNKSCSVRVSSMTLFPDHSGYERMLVLMNQHGRGMIWDWVNEEQVVQLHMPVDCKLSKNQSDHQQNNNLSTTVRLRSRIYYWGVHATLALNMDDSPAGANKRAFRIVTMADGSNDEWESCWWNVDFQALNQPEATLTAPPIVDRNIPYSPVSSETTPPLVAVCQKIESKILGVSQSNDHMDQNFRPIHIISYVMWNNYVIALSSSLGIFMLDITQPSSQSHCITQWISFLPDRTIAMDFSIFGNNLIITHTTGHFVWSFYGKSKSFHLAPKSLGLQTTSIQ